MQEWEFLVKEDVFIGNYRSHGHYLAKGGNLYALFAEILGRAEGCSGGFGGSMHITDRACGFYGSSAIVGSTIAIATGVALGIKYHQRSKVVIVFFGDGAMEEGIIYESVNFALLHKLPIIFVCENNQMAIDTPLSLRSVPFPLFKRFQTMGIPSSYVKPNSISKTIEKIAMAFQYVRQKKSPYFLEFQAARWASHVGSTVLGPLDLWWKDPLTKEARSCPLARTVQFLLRLRIITLTDIHHMYHQLQGEIESLFTQALNHTTLPSPITTDRVTYASGLEAFLPIKKIKRNMPEYKENEYSRITNPF